jgi:hypothetical protein
VTRAALLLIVLAACKKEAPKQEPEPEPAPQMAETKPAPDAPEPAGAAAARIAADVPTAKVEQGKAAVAGLDTAGACTTPPTGTDRGRMTRRPRNPANEVAGWQEEALAHFESLVAAGATLDGAAFARTLDGGAVAYAQPVVIAEGCLTCHGENAAPEDRATGYRVGDLRGLAWAEVP